MTEELNAATFDIGDLFSGKIYPKDTVEVYLDEEVAYELQKNSKAAMKAVQEEDEEAAKAIAERHEELVKRGEKSRVIFHLTGVSRDHRQAIVDKVLEEYPLEYNFLGQPKPNSLADEKHANLRWALHIESIERADGSVLVAPTADQVKIFRGNAPDSEILKIENAIIDLSEGVKGGFETLAQEHAFLSQP